MKKSRICTGFVTVFLAVVVATSSLPARAEPFIGLPSVQELRFFTQISGDKHIADFYRHRNYAPIWIGDDPAVQKRLNALRTAISTLDTHGLPSHAVESDGLWDIVVDMNNPDEVVKAELAFTKLYLDYAHTISSGWLDPRDVSEAIDVRKLKTVPADYLLSGMVENEPGKFLSQLAPQSMDYAHLRKELIRLQNAIDQGGWGELVDSSELKSGDKGDEVVKLRNRLIRMNYLSRSVSNSFDRALRHAVRMFQRDHGLIPTGIAGTSTIKAVNVEPEERLRSVVASLERSRWMNRSLGSQYVIVNIPEFRARYFDGGELEFETTVVVGKNEDGLQTPEFSREMEFIVVNPIWNVPVSIITEEIFPALRRDLSAEANIQFYDSDGETIDRLAIDLSTRFTPQDFPYRAKQFPGPTNPLGGVKFMFPNRHSIYLHDSPVRELFSWNYRAHSHGCIRLQDAHDFARLLLAKEGHDYDELVYFTEGTENEIEVHLKSRIPVHITYKTAWVGENGHIHYRSDVYRRDELIFAALNAPVPRMAVDGTTEMIVVQAPQP